MIHQLAKSLGFAADKLLVSADEVGNLASVHAVMARKVIFLDFAPQKLAAMRARNVFPRISRRHCGDCDIITVIG